MQFKKTFLTLICCLAVLGTAVSGSLAYFFDSSAPLTNVFFPATVDTEIVEELDGAVKSNVRLKNTGNTAAYLRATYLLSWKAEDGSYHSSAPEGVHLELGSGWIKAADGFYYWPMPVAPGDQTGILIVTCDPGDSTAPEGYALNLEIIGSAIQSDPKNAVTENWNSGVSGVDATGRLELKLGGGS